MQSVPLYLTAHTRSATHVMGSTSKQNILKKTTNFQKELAIGSDFILSHWSLNLLQSFSAWATQAEEGQPEQSPFRAVG